MPEGAHRLIRHAAVRELPGYDPFEAPAIVLGETAADLTRRVEVDYGRPLTVPPADARGSRMYLARAGEGPLPAILELETDGAVAAIHVEVTVVEGPSVVPALRLVDIRP